MLSCKVQRPMVLVEAVSQDGFSNTRKVGLTSACSWQCRLSRPVRGTGRANRLCS